MYQYDPKDQQIINERVAQFQDQTARFLDGKIADEHFLPLRLQNGLYVQRHAPMLRINIPYGMLNSIQLRALAKISRDYDKGYLHFTTRQNVQLNWPALENVPAILADLAKVEMHAVQSSGNCIRNITSDPFAGVAQDEIVDPRPYSEIIRQWSTFHPEFAHLPRKFKIAVSATEEDRAAIRAHDIGLQVRKQNDQIGFRVFVGGGLGRTPVVGVVIDEFIAEKDILTYLEAIMRVYNLLGRRDNKYKARIKILVRAMGIEAFKAKVETEWASIKDSKLTLTQAEIDRVSGFFSEPDYQQNIGQNNDHNNDELLNSSQLQEQLNENSDFATWYDKNTRAHKYSAYCSVILSLKPTGIPPGDVTDQQMEVVADLADQYSFGEVRTTHQQNLVLADVAKNDLFSLWQDLIKVGFATANYGLLTDMICCPGGDFCSLANAKSIPVAEAIQRQYKDMDAVYNIGPLDMNISGCMNACGHHHLGHIGILGVDKKGKEFFQVSLGGDSGYETKMAAILGPSFSREEVPAVIDKILALYLELRQNDERFIDTFKRIGMAPFKERVYG